MYTPHFALVY